MIVYRLENIEQVESLSGQTYCKTYLFNPVQDGNTPPNWVISSQEVDQLCKTEFLWIKDLQQIEWVQPPYPDDIYSGDTYSGDTEGYVGS